MSDLLQLLDLLDFMINDMTYKYVCSNIIVKNCIMQYYVTMQDYMNLLEDTD